MKAHKWILALVVNLFVFIGPAEAQHNPFDLWASRNSETTWHLLGVAYGHGTYVAVGGLPPFDPSGPIQASLLSSPDGVTWTKLALPTNANFYGVSCVNDRFIAVGDFGLIMASPDGVSWALQNSSAQNATSDIYPLGGVAFGNGTYVAMDRLLGNNCLVSADGTNWVTRTLQSGSSFVEMDRVHFDNGLFVAGGLVNNAAILTSTNGVNWIPHLSPLPGSGINDLAYGAGRWVAVGDLAGVITSSNALTWTKVQVPAALTQTNINFHGIVYSDGFFVVVGDSGTVLTSPDGLNWISRSSPGTAALNAIAFGTGSLVAVGLSGVVWQSAPILHLTVGWQNEGANLTLSSPSGLNCVVQTSSDLINWTNLFSIPMTQTTQTLLDTNALTSPQRSYRAITQTQ